jgi:glycine cleavage system H protein
MLGDIVEYQFDVEPGSRIGYGQKIGWIEGFKAVSDLFAVAEGDFLGGNAGLRGDITRIESDPFESGWLYEVKGRPEAGGMDASGYATVLDATIDKMLESRHESGKENNE